MQKITAASIIDMTTEIINMVNGTKLGHEMACLVGVLWTKEMHDYASIHIEAHMAIKQENKIMDGIPRHRLLRSTAHR